MNLVQKVIRTAVVSLMAVSTAVNTYAATASTTQALTLKEAVNRAISSCDKKTVYSRYLDAYDEITKYNRDVFDPTYRNYKLNQKTYEYNLKHINEKIAYDTTDAYLSVISLNKQIDMAKNNVEITQKKLNQALIKKNKGMISQLEYKKAEDALNSAQTSLVALQKSLDNEVLTFKNLTNMDITKYQLDSEFELEPAAIKEAASSYFDKKLEDFYSLKQDAIDISELGQKLNFSGDITVGEYDLQEAHIVSNKYTLKDLKQTMSTSLMNCYNSLEPLKAKVENYEIQIDSADKTLKAQEVRYNGGYISKLDYEEALILEQQLKCDQFTAVKDYITAKMKVEEPNILAMQ